MGTLLKTRVKPDNDRIMSSIICINGEHSYLISLMPFFYLGLRTIPIVMGTMAGSYRWTPILFRAWIHFFMAVVQCPLWPSYGWQVWLTILCEIHRILECIALHTRQQQAAIYFVKINEVFQLKILPHLGSRHFKLCATPGPDDIFQSINIQTMVFLRFSVLQNISRLLKLQKIALRAFYMIFSPVTRSWLGPWHENGRNTHLRPFLYPAVPSEIGTRFLWA